MSQPAVVVEGLSKAYRIGHKEDVPDSLLGAIQGIVRSPWKNFQRLRRLNTFGTNGRDAEDMIWALKDVSFEVAEGEVVGIIGRNGAGKSTLLKILSRITEPTSGRALIHGRVSSLLEVGTGFHPELTGRENIYMNGTILGMTKREIDRKFDEIVDFSGVEKFLDTPIKRYSSGMQVRLAFSVAAHLEPEILIVDEVLAVGDAEFQKKCVGKMHDVAKGGRTVLLVSHNMAAVRSLCQRAILLRSGRLHSSGDVDSVMGAYIQTFADATRKTLCESTKREGSGDIIFTYFELRNVSGTPIEAAKSGDDVQFVFGFKSQRSGPKKGLNVGFAMHSSTDERLTVLYSRHTGAEFGTVPHTGEFHCRVRRLPFNPGSYRVVGQIEINGALADRPVDGCGRFDVVAGDYYGTGRQTVDRYYSPFLIDGNWTMLPDCQSNVTGNGVSVAVRRVSGSRLSCDSENG